LSVLWVEQAGLLPEREMELSLRFSGPVEWPSLADRLTLMAGGRTLRWQFVGNPRGAAGVVRTLDPVFEDRIEVRIDAGVKPAAREYAALPAATTRLVAVVPEFRFVSLEAFTPSFGQPYLVAQFTQTAEARDAAALIACEPAVPLTVTPESCCNGLRVEGPFEIGRTYTLSFKGGLRSRAGHRLKEEVRRTAVIRHREPCVAIPLEGCYLAPAGDLQVPVLAVNAPHVESSLARVLPQNLVQYAMREGGHYSGWWRDDAASLAEELTDRAAVRTNRTAAARDQEERLLLRLRDYAEEPVRGAYVLSVSAPRAEPCSRLICVTDLGLSARSDRDAVTVWVTALGSGRPVSGAKVELYGRNNLLWAQGESDTQGLARLACREGEGMPLLVLARSADGRDVSVLRLTEGSAVEERSEATRAYPARGVCESYLLSDRDIYRHGERVFMQALLRDRYGKPPAPFPTVLHVVKPDGRTFKTLAVMPDRLGAAVAEVMLPDYLPSGTYTFALRLPGEGAVLGERRVMLEAFVPPQIRVKLSEMPAAVPAGGELAFSVSAEHLFGRPAAGLSVEAVVALSAGEFKPKGWEGYVFGDQERVFAVENVQCPRLSLDASGCAAFSARLGVGGLPCTRLKALVEATVTQTGGRTAAARAETAVDPYPFYIGIRPGGGAGVRAGESRELRLAAVWPDGARRTEPTPLDVRIEKVTWVSSLLKEANGRYRWESERVKTLVQEGRVETGAEDAAFAFAVQGTGDYLITFTDPVTRAASSWAFAANEHGQADGAWSRESPDRVELVCDRTSYRPGETARVQVRAPFAGQAWVVLSGDRLLESRVLELTNNTVTLEWEVTEAFAPNVAVSVSVVRPAIAESVWSAHRASGSTLLRVLPPQRALTVRVRSDAEVWRPRGRGRVRVALTDNEGRPAGGAAVTVLAVDEGVCRLTDYETPDPYGYFTEPRRGDLTFYDVYRSLMPITEERALDGASHVGGDAGGGMFKRLNPIAARRFKPLALWQANVRADAGGEAEVSFDLPEFAGELRLMAVAWDERAVGAGEAAVKVRRKLVVQPELPRFLAPGDRTCVEVALHNESGAACAVRLFVRCEGPLVGGGASPEEVALAAGESRVVRVPVQAQERAGTARVNLLAEGAGEVYEETIELAVRPVAALRVTDERTVIEPGQERVFEPPRGVLAGSVAQTVFCSGQPAVNLLGALAYVTEYPYGCLEQTVSSALPLLALSGLEGRLPYHENTLAQEAPARVNAAILRVQAMRRWDGFAPWPDVWASDPNATLYAALFLAEAERAGYTLPERAVAEVAENVRDRLAGERVSRAYACHVLALAGRPEYGWSLRLFEQAEKLSQEERFHLARALIRGGDAERGRELLVQTPSAKGLREAAFALLAWLDIDPSNPAVAACCGEIERARRGEGHWGSTQDNALALLAMGSYLRATPERPQRFEPFFVWGGQTVSAGPTNTYVWTSGEGAGGEEVLRVRNGGPGPMYAVRRVSCVPLAAGGESRVSGLTVRREWLNLAGERIDPAALHRGDLVVVRLTVDPVERTISDVVVEDLLPAGLEIESAQAAGAGAPDWIKREEADWVLHREARDDRLLLFAKPLSSPAVFHYVARAVSTGVFAIPPVAASAMYDPETYSRWGGGRVVIAE